MTTDDPAAEPITALIDWLADLPQNELDHVGFLLLMVQSPPVL
jgi:hypothetical protein